MHMQQPWYHRQCIALLQRWRHAEFAPWKSSSKSSSRSKTLFMIHMSHCNIYDHLINIHLFNQDIIAQKVALNLSAAHQESTRMRWEHGPAKYVMLDTIVIALRDQSQLIRITSVQKVGMRKCWNLIPF
jgi:hypothetical protein